MRGCGPFVTYSNANRTLLFDIHKETWPDDLVSKSGLDASFFPRCIPGGGIVGTVSDKTAQELGLLPGVLIAAEGHDQCCSALGAGIAQGVKAVDGMRSNRCHYTCRCGRRGI